MGEGKKTAAGSRKGADPGPIYYKLQLELQRKIETGAWGPGHVIPPEREIAEDYDFSLGTVRKAILNLVNEGLLYRVQGKGTMVAGTTMMRETLLYYRFQRDFQLKEAALKIEMLSLETIPGDERINRLLKVRPDEELYLLRRRFSSLGRPVIYSTSYLPKQLLAGLDGVSRSVFEKIPLYLTIEDRFGIPTVSNKELIGSEGASPEVAGILDVPPGTATLVIEMLSMGHKKRPYEYRVAYCLTDRGRLVREY